MNIICNQVEVLKAKIRMEGVEELLSLIYKKIKKNNRISKSLVSDFEKCLYQRTGDE